MFYSRNLNFIPTSSSTESESSVFELLKSYLDANPKTGYVVFQIYHDSVIQGVIPVANAKITVSKLLGNSYFISKVLTTDGDGKTEPIPLPTVKAELSMAPGDGKMNSTYSARVEAPNFYIADVFEISVFEGITSIQPINLLPNIEGNKNQINQVKPQQL